jgi:outer membrane protein
MNKKIPDIRETINISLMVLFFVLPIFVQAQEKWTLKQCIHYAVKNNIDLNIQKNRVKQQKINFHESKANLFPDLNLGSDWNVNYGRNIDATTNDITFHQTMSNSYWLSSSVDIFQGFVKQNTIRYQKYLLLAYKEENKKLENQLIFKIITSFYTALYSEGLENVAKNQEQLSKNLYERMMRLVEVGKKSPLLVQELKSQWATDQLNYTIAKNRKEQEFLSLKKLLRLTSKSDFEIDSLEGSHFVLMSELDRDSIFFEALSVLPEMKQQKFLLNAYEKNLAVAKGRVSPRLYMSAGYNTGFYDGAEANYGEQIINNQSQQIRMGVLIPVFNNASTHSNIKRKKIDLDNQTLLLEKEKEQIYATIQNMTDNLKGAEKEYYSSLELLDFANLSFKNISTKMEKGLANATDFETAKQRLSAAKAAKLKAKLSYIMYQQILEFYISGSWNHL